MRAMENASQSKHQRAKIRLDDRLRELAVVVRFAAVFAERTAMKLVNDKSKTSVAKRHWLRESVPVMLREGLRECETDIPRARTFRRDSGTLAATIIAIVMKIPPSARRGKQTG